MTMLDQLEVTIQRNKEAVTMGDIIPMTKATVDKRRDVHVRNVRDVKRLINNTINELRAGELDSKRANAIGYLANILLKIFETEDVISKLDSIEERLRRIADK